MWNEDMKKFLQNLEWDIIDWDHDQAVEEKSFHTESYSVVICY